MAWPPRDDQDGGYATPAAMVISLALAMVATAVAQTSTAELRLARADLRRTQAEYALAGAHTRAIIAVLGSDQGGRIQWTLTTDGGAFDVLAEPEAPKLGLKAASVLADASWAAFRVTKPEGMRANLRAASGSTAGARGHVREAAASPLWRACALSMLSPYGTGSALALSEAEPLQTGEMTWRAGEVWRFRVSGAGGWTDDRIVRFTGDPGHPAAVVERDFSRGEARGEPCQALIEADAKP